MARQRKYSLVLSHYGRLAPSNLRLDQSQPELLHFRLAKTDYFGR